MAEPMHVPNRRMLPANGASHAYFLLMAKQRSEDSNGMQSTASANQIEGDEEIASVNFFPLCR